VFVAKETREKRSRKRLPTVHEETGMLLATYQYFAGDDGDHSCAEISEAEQISEHESEHDNPVSENARPTWKFM